MCVCVRVCVLVSTYAFTLSSSQLPFFVAITVTCDRFHDDVIQQVQRLHITPTK